ncbi:MAG: hypothetical protein KatS3mg115_1676 [Candidatus Poribacteria bacterium]|nr:MAG: hypothetical protein KatS3mg115_1676 [Candidatus Poribacteria bacterium]
MTTQEGASVQERFQAALESFLARVQEDRRVLAAILFGSLSYDEVWEQSDVDILLIAQDDAQSKSYVLCEDGLFFHVHLLPRREFRKEIEGSLQSGFIHSSLARSRLLFTRDESIREYYEQTRALGDRDRELQRMRWATWLLPTFIKAEKWYVVKRDYAYAYKWLLEVLDGLAALEVLDHGEVTSRENLQRACELSPELFRPLYLELMDQPKNAKTVGAALDRVRTYLLNRAGELFRPLFDYLKEEGTPRTATEIAERFERVAQNREIVIACEWLAYHGFLVAASQPTRLTPKSRTTVEEAAFYYDEWRELP